MPETRMLPRATPRSTGIERTNVQGGNRQQAAGTGASSHVSAAPGAGARVHEHVVNARNPAAAAAQKSPAQKPAGQAQPQNGGVSVTRGRQDAKVQLVSRGNGGAAGFDRPTVQLMDATQAAQLARPGARLSSSAPQGFDARGAFNADQLTLMGSLLGQYKERLEAIPGDPSANAATIGMCGDALERIAYLLKGGTFAPAATPAAAGSLASSAAGATAKIDEGSDAESEPSGDPDGQG